MTLANWIPAFVTTGVLALLGWLLRVPFQRVIEGAISSAFDKKLEGVRSDFRREEEKLSAELKERAAEIESFRSGAMVNFTSRQAELGRRRLVAVERVWAEVSELGKYKHLATFAQSLNVDAIIESTSKSANDRQKMSDFATLLLGNLADLKTQPYEATANKERLFVPELTFALFMTYRQILLWPFILLHTLKAQADGKLLTPGHLVDLARKALPHQGPFLDQHGVGGLPFLVDELETAVLASLREALEQKESDAAALAQASGLIAAVNESAKPNPVQSPVGGEFGGEISVPAPS